MLTVVTPTGARPDAFALCRRMMARQDYRGRILWIIVDDGDPAQEPTLPPAPNWQVLTVRPYPLWAPGQNTQGRNLIAALDVAEAHAIEGGYDLRLTVVEDDDWYAPQWLRKVDCWLKEAPLVGEGFSTFYNVQSRFHGGFKNRDHASLRSTAMRGDALARFRDVLARPERFYDLKLWQSFCGGRTFIDRLTLGIKGMPGRAGIAEGHDAPASNDRDLCWLRSTIGADADFYARYGRTDKMSGLRTVVALRPFRYQTRRIKGEAFAVKFGVARVLVKQRLVEYAPDAAATVDSNPIDDSARPEFLDQAKERGSQVPRPRRVKSDALIK